MPISRALIRRFNRLLNMDLTDLLESSIRGLEPPRGGSHLAYSVENMRLEIVPEPLHVPRRITRPEGFVFIGGRQSGRSYRGIMAMGSGNGPGCKEWIRGYRDNYDLKRFYDLFQRPVNAPDKLEGRRKINYVETDSHFLTGGPLHFFDPDERPTD